MSTLLNPGDRFSKDFSVHFKLEVRPYSTKELSNLYNVEPKTFRKWISKFQNDIGEKIGCCYNVRQVEVIFAALGIPYLLMKKEQNKKAC